MYGGMHTRARDDAVARERHSIAVKSPSPITPYERVGGLRGCTPGGPTPSPTAAYYAAAATAAAAAAAATTAAAAGSLSSPPPLSPSSPSLLALRMMATTNTTATTIAAAASGMSGSSGGNSSNNNNNARCYAPPPPLQSLARHAVSGRANIFDDDAHTEAPVSLAGSPNATVYGTASPLARNCYRYDSAARRRSSSSSGGGSSSIAGGGGYSPVNYRAAVTPSARGSGYAMAAAAAVRPASATAALTRRDTVTGATITTTTTAAAAAAPAMQRPLTCVPATAAPHTRTHGGNTLVALAHTARHGGSGSAAVPLTVTPPPPPQSSLTMTASTRPLPSQPRRVFSDRCGVLVEEHDPVTLSLVARYRCGALLGSGGFAQVYEFVDTQTSVVYACKILDRGKLGPSAEARVRAEVEIQRSLRHRHIVHVVKSFLDAHYLYILLECCSRKSLMDVATERGVLTSAELRHVGRQLASALAYMHARGVIHRDVKLANVLVDRAGDVKLGDFGFACRVRSAAERKVRVCGTPNYIAPEILACQDACAPSPSTRCAADDKDKQQQQQQRGSGGACDEDVDDDCCARRAAAAATTTRQTPSFGYSFEVDVWSLGVLLFILAYGHAPFQARDVPATYQRIRQLDYRFPADAAARVPDECRRLIAAMLHGDPRRRPTAAQLLHSAFLRGNSNNSSGGSSGGSSSSHMDANAAAVAAAASAKPIASLTRYVTASAQQQPQQQQTAMTAAVGADGRRAAAATSRARTPRHKPYPPAAVVHAAVHMSKYGYGLLLCLHGRVLPAVVLNDRTKLLYDGDSDTALYFARQPRTSTAATTATTGVRAYCDELVVYEHATRTLGGGGSDGSDGAATHRNDGDNNANSTTATDTTTSADAVLRRAAQKKLAITRCLYPHLLQAQQQQQQQQQQRGSQAMSVAHVCTGFACTRTLPCRDRRLFALDSSRSRCTAATPSPLSPPLRAVCDSGGDEEDEATQQQHRCSQDKDDDDGDGTVVSSSPAAAAGAVMSSSLPLLSRPLVYVKEAHMLTMPLRSNTTSTAATPPLQLTSLALRLSNQSFQLALRFEHASNNSSSSTASTATTASTVSCAAAAAAAVAGAVALPWALDVLIYDNYHALFAVTQASRVTADCYTVYNLRRDVEVHTASRTYYACGATHSDGDGDSDDSHKDSDACDRRHTLTAGAVLTLPVSVLQLIANRLRAVRCPASIVECFD